MRSVSRLPRLLLAGCAMLALSSAAALADSSIGVNAAIRNSVQTKDVAEAALHPAVVRGPVHLGETVVSGDKSALQILLVDQSVFTVGANARMTIDRFVYDPDRGASDVAASVAKGAFRFMSGPTLGGQGRNAIASPVATIGVRGTIVEGAVGPDALTILEGQPGLPPINANPDSATLVVLRGPGHFNQGFDKPGAIDVTANGVTVAVEHPGQAILVPGPGQAPIGPFFLSDNNFERLSSLLRTQAEPGGPQGTTELGDVGSAGANSGDNMNAGAVGDPYTNQTNSIDLPLAPPRRPETGDFSNGPP
jgi:hypothetical protein